LNAEFTAASAARRPQPAPGHLRRQGAGEDAQLRGWAGRPGWWRACQPCAPLRDGRRPWSSQCSGTPPAARV